MSSAAPKQPMNRNNGLPGRPLSATTPLVMAPKMPIGREAAAGGAHHDQDADQHRVDPEALAESECDRRHDGHGRRGDRADGGDRRADHEHRPGNQRHPAADRADRGVHDPVDGAVVLRQREEVGDPDQDDEEIARGTRTAPASVRRRTRWRRPRPRPPGRARPC